LVDQQVFKTHFMATDSTKRFSNRVEDYVKYRPGYPKSILNYLSEDFGLSAEKVIADIGSGTGISTEMFLAQGYAVFAVEPNKEMRDKATELLGHYTSYHEVDGTAESTTLADSSVDAIVAGQAFHWFQPEQTRNEFSRILKKGGLVVLIWNERLTASAFEVKYDKLIIRHGKDYVQVDHRNISADKIESFFSPSPFAYKAFANKQVFDFDGLKGRLLSSSYMPSVHEEGYDEMIEDLRVLFDQYQEGGLITINYDTKVYTGRL
jgi:SAM-dependent methyltransferase